MPAAAPAPAADERCLVDAGLLMGRSFRVGWSPQGLLAYPGTLPSPCHQLCLSIRCCHLRTALKRVQGVVG
jgi:hypothetical protein